MSLYTTSNINLEHLLAELRRVTVLVSERVNVLRSLNPAEEEDEFRGLYVSEEEVNALLADPALFQPGDTLDMEQSNGLIKSSEEQSRLQHLQSVFNLSPFELNVVLIALAPELDLRYEKLYAYLQDDVTRRRPTVDLTLQLLCPGLAAQVAARRSFDPESPLLKYRLIELSDENQAKQISLLSRTLKLDEGVIAYLLGENRLDHRLRSVADFATDEGHQIIAPQIQGYLERLIELADDGFVCTLVGSDETSKRDLALALGRHFGLPLLNLSVASLALQNRQENLIRLLERECAMRSTVLFLTDYEIIFREEGNLQETRPSGQPIIEKSARYSVHI